MLQKNIVQVYKPPNQWRSAPIGVGDYLRGACYLVDVAQKHGLRVRFDVSATEFSKYIAQDPRYFSKSDPSRIAEAPEYFKKVVPTELFAKIDDLVAADGVQDLLVCTNLGAWQRAWLTDEARSLTSHFFDFIPRIHEANLAVLGEAPYTVLSVRCGDSFFNSAEEEIASAHKALLFRTIEERILVSAAHPILVTSDSLLLKRELGNRYGVLYLDHVPQHGAFGGSVEPVVRDLDLLKHSSFNYFINAGYDWWSGFSHYTSMIFGIPDLNIAPVRLPRPPKQRWWHLGFLPGGRATKPAKR